MSNKTFELGLVGAGAISAGAYTAGIIDFLIQALDTWYDLKSKNENVPQHDVKISVFSGASAGAMTAAIAAAYIGSNQHPVINEVDEKSELNIQKKKSSANQQISMPKVVFRWICCKQLNNVNFQNE